MIDKSVIEKASQVIANNRCKAAAYRLKIFPLPSDSGLKAGEVEKYETLKKLGLQVQTDLQTERETKGADMAIIVDVGPSAFTDPRLEDTGIEAGMVIKYMRYAGHLFDDPPGSGINYRLINDEDILGYYQEKVL